MAATQASIVLTSLILTSAICSQDKPHLISLAAWIYSFSLPFLLTPISLQGLPKTGCSPPERVKEDAPLLNYSDTPIVRHVKIPSNRSPYDGDWIYWSSRRGKHPETPKRIALLLKKQKGKCNHCGLHFKEGDLIEVDHIIPSSHGGKDEYKNLQLLHRHCHDQKTATDGSLTRTRVKGSVREEPDDTKVSSPVLKTSRRGDSPA